MANSTTYFKSNPIKPSVAESCQRPRVLPPRRQLRLSFYETPDPMKKISGRRKFRRRVKSAGTGGSVQGRTAFGVGLCSKAKERISGPSRASGRNAGPVGEQPGLSLRGAERRSNLKAEIATLPPVARNDTRCARNDNQTMDGVEEGGRRGFRPVGGQRGSDRQFRAPPPHHLSSCRRSGRL